MLSCQKLPVLVGFVSAALAAPASGCEITKYLELPVTMEGGRPIVSSAINGREARFILDSGAFFSTISSATAQEYGLVRLDVVPGVRLKGIGGDTSLRAADIKEFRLGNQTLTKVQFAVGGSDTGYAGLLGQNILGIADVEYDLAHGAVRLMRGKNCRNVLMAYWAGERPATVIELEPVTRTQRHTIGRIKLNGQTIRATFDTGAMGSMLTLAAARRLGVKLDSPGVMPSGFAYGIGQGRVQTWRARFDSMDLGGESIPRPLLTIADQPIGDSDMLIGIDFFMTHRIYVDNQARKMFVTYEGGPVFGLNPKAARDDTGKVLDLTDRSAEPTTAEAFSRRGAVRASSGKSDDALADFDRAIALAPNEASYFLQRAKLRLDRRQMLLAAGDLDKAVTLAPADAEARLIRARLRLGAHDKDGAAEDLKAADSTLPASADARLLLASLYTAIDAPAAALPSLDAWLASHPEDHSRAAALNSRCWARGLLNRELDLALSDCNAAVRLQPGNASYLDSRALVRLRRGELKQARADYDAAIKGAPRSAWSLYGRSLVARQAGDVAQATADEAAALAIDPRVAERAKGYGLVRPAG